MDTRKPLWPALAALAFSLLLFAAGPLGLWGRLAGHLPLGGPLFCLGLAAVGLLPLIFAALSLERGRPAPALRAWPAPWVLAGLVYACIQVSGGSASPLYGMYVLLGLYLARQSAWPVALGVILLISVLEALPFALANSEQRQSPWPGMLVLAWPLLGLLAGLLTQGPRPARMAEAPSPVKVPKQAAEEAASAWAMEDGPQLLGAGQDAGSLLEMELQASLDLAASSHPAWNGLALWWGDAERLTLRGLRLRAGTPAPIGTELAAGEGLLGLALREMRPLNVEPLAPGAGRSLPYYGEPGPARVLRALPLADEGQVIGLLACDKADEAPFSGDEVDALDALARSLVAHAQRAAYLSRLQAGSQRTNKLYEAAKSLASSLDRDDLLARFGTLLGSVVAQDSWALAWREGADGPFVRLASAGYASSAGAALGLDQNTALSGVLQQADAGVIFNAGSSAIPAALNEGLAKPAQHFLLIPLRLSGRLAGVLKLDRRLAPFEADERDNALIFGSQAAVTLENARLFSLHQRLATTDGLTGLYNHRYFQERLATELVHAERTGKPLSLGLTDIDHFKNFNDTFGHQEGDVVLKRVAQLLKDQARPGKDVVCRYGGEEFVIIMPDCDLVEARQVLDALRHACGSTLIGGSGPEARAITLSVGISAYPLGAKEQRDLIHSADEALYKAKKSGRDRVCSYKDLP